jgi:hypothetical protein
MNRAQTADYMFLCRITHDASTPEYNGFNTDMAHPQDILSRTMEALPDEMLPEYTKGNHVMSHKPGLWNSF